ncbi:MAG: radical SAM protein, partial [Candidatus Hodarchaeales archaeon]
MKKIEELYNRRKSFLKKKIEEHPLEIVIWEATTKCNLHCIHCGSPPQNSIELTTEEVIDAFKNIREQFGTEKIRYIAITGGEPTIR